MNSVSDLSTTPQDLAGYTRCEECGHLFLISEEWLPMGYCEGCWLNRQQIDEEHDRRWAAA